MLIEIGKVKSSAGIDKESYFQYMSKQDRAKEIRFLSASAKAKVSS